MKHETEDEQDHPDLATIIQKVNEHVDTRLTYLRLNFSEKVAVVISKAGSLSIVLVLFLLFFFFLNVAAALWIGKYFGDNVIGFAAVSGFYFLISILVLIFRKSVVEKKIQDSIVKSIYPENEEDEDNED
jgi:hypothetical protein